MQKIIKLKINNLMILTIKVYVKNLCTMPKVQKSKDCLMMDLPALYFKVDISI